MIGSAQPEILAARLIVGVDLDHKRTLHRPVRHLVVDGKIGKIAFGHLPHLGNHRVSRGDVHFRCDGLAVGIQRSVGIARAVPAAIDSGSGMIEEDEQIFCVAAGAPQPSM